MQSTAQQKNKNGAKQRGYGAPAKATAKGPRRAGHGHGKGAIRYAGQSQGVTQGEGATRYDGQGEGEGATRYGGQGEGATRYAGQGHGEGAIRYGGRRTRLRTTGLRSRRCTCTRKGAVVVFGWVLFFDFVWVTTRAEGPHGGASYVRGAERNRIDRHRGGIERLAMRTST